MEIKDISKRIIDYILADVNLSLSRLGISEPLVEVKSLADKNYRSFESAPIKQSPMLFKKLIVKGTMFYEQGSSNDFISMNLRYSWVSFGGGENGVELGSVCYRFIQPIPEDDDLRYYIKKERGIGI